MIELSITTIVSKSIFYMGALGHGRIELDQAGAGPHALATIMGPRATPERMHTGRSPRGGRGCRAGQPAFSPVTHQYLTARANWHDRTLTRAQETADVYCSEEEGRARKGG